MRRAIIFHQLRIGDALGRGAAGRIDRHRLVAGAVNHQRRHPERRQIGAEIRRREGLRTGQRRPVASLHREAPRPVEGRIAHRTGDIADAEKALEEIAHEGRTVLLHALGHFVEGRLRHAVGIVIGLQHIGHDRGDQARADHAFAIVSRHVSRHFAAAHRKADDRHVPVGAGLAQHVAQIVGKRVVIVAAPRLPRSSETAPIIGDGAETRLGQRLHLRIPAVG